MQRTFFRHPELAGALTNHAPQRSTEPPPRVFSVKNSIRYLEAEFMTMREPATMT
jgi:hypothetical protein